MRVDMGDCDLEYSRSEKATWINLVM